MYQMVNIETICGGLWEEEDIDEKLRFLREHVGDNRVLAFPLLRCYFWYSLGFY
jgi:hypothetical protein